MTLAIIALAVVLPTRARLRRAATSYTVAAVDPTSRAVAEAAERGADGVRRQDRGRASSRTRAAGTSSSNENIDAYLEDGRLVSREKPDDKLVDILQAANRDVRSAEALRRAGLPEDELQRRALAARAARARSPRPPAIARRS